jgi:DNA-3-methyladenine glycosylase I
MATIDMRMSSKNVERCGWGSAPGLMSQYHDNEWGFPTADDTHLFEKICLEGFQSGLSWSTILNKREDCRRVFCGFDIDQVAGFDERDIECLVGDATIVRHRGKIRSTINNAQRCLELIDEVGSLASYIWGFEPKSISLDVRAISPESTALSKDLKKRGWSFVGPTTMYAFMQSLGLVNDHSTECFVREQVDAARGKFLRPV